MKTLKLQVGKTYRSREGEEVKIVRKNNNNIFPYQGSNGKLYYEGGKWSYVAEEHPKDLIEEVPEASHTFGLVPGALTATRYTFTIPEGAKKVTVSQEGNRIIVEMVPEEGEPKPKTVKAENKCVAHTSEDVKKMINLREMNKVLTRIKKVYMLKDIDVRSRLGRQVEARAIWAYYLIEVEGIQHADAAKIVGRKRPMMYHYVKLVKDLYETNVPFRERFNKIGIPWRS
jgi:hypothetical protein